MWSKIQILIIKELEYNKKVMPKKRPPIKPFLYGKYLVEYKEDKAGLLRFYKEQIDTLKRAEEVCEELIVKGYHDPVIKKVG